MPSPLAHIAALGSALLMPLRIGARTALMTGWQPDRAVEIIAQERVTYMSGANVFIHDLVQRYAAGASPEYRLGNFYSGGSGGIGIVRHHHILNTPKPVVPATGA